MKKQWFKTPNGTLVYVEAGEIKSGDVHPAFLADGKCCGSFSGSYILISWTPCDAPEVEVEADQVRVDDWSDASLVLAVIGDEAVCCWRNQDGDLCARGKKISGVRKWPLHDDQDGQRKRIRGE